MGDNTASERAMTECLEHEAEAFVELGWGAVGVPCSPQSGPGASSHSHPGELVRKAEYQVPPRPPKAETTLSPGIRLLSSPLGAADTAQV